METMKNNHTTKRDNPYGGFPISCATREMVRERTEELATLSGRRSYDINQRDYEQAKRELTGERDSDKQQAILNLNERRILRVRS